MPEEESRNTLQAEKDLDAAAEAINSLKDTLKNIEKDHPWLNAHLLGTKPERKTLRYGALNDAQKARADELHYFTSDPQTYVVVKTIEKEASDGKAISMQHMVTGEVCYRTDEHGLVVYATREDAILHPGNIRAYLEGHEWSAVYEQSFFKNYFTTERVRV